MNAKWIALALCLIVGMFAGCIAWEAPVQPPRGGLITIYSAPLSIEGCHIPVGGKEGTASTMYFRDILITGLGFAWDDASIEEAARNGGISKIYYADYEITEILGMFGKLTTKVHGE